MVWLSSAAEEACKCLYRKTSAYLSGIFHPGTHQNGQNSKALKDQNDSAVYIDDEDHNPGSSWSYSRSSSQCSICSCMACSQQGEWKRRPSRLLEGYDVEDFYKFDAVLGKNYAQWKLSLQFVLQQKHG